MIGAATPWSHTFVFRQELINLKVAQATEHLVSLGDLDLLQMRADNAAQPGIQAAAVTSDDDNEPGGTVPPARYHCTIFAFFPPGP
jgi:hypothetical protein